MVERVERKERAQARAKATANAPGPTEIRSHLVRTELLKASVWLGLALLIAACIVLIQPILLIFAAISWITAFHIFCLRLCSQTILIF